MLNMNLMVPTYVKVETYTLLNALYEQFGEEYNRLILAKCKDEEQLRVLGNLVTALKEGAEFNKSRW